MGSLLFMGNPYQHAPAVSIVRTDTCSMAYAQVLARVIKRMPRLLSSTYQFRFFM